MVRKPDPRKKRIHELRRHADKTAVSEFPSFAQLASKYCPPAFPSKKVDFAEALTSPGKISKEKLWTALARRALTLGVEDDAGTRAMRRAFDVYKLDPENPFSWRLLVEHFSYVEFFEKTKAKLKWSGGRIMELRREIIKWNLQKAHATVIAKTLSSNKASNFYGSREQVRIHVGKLRKAQKMFGLFDV
jgi:hypothetical protein